MPCASIQTTNCRTCMLISMLLYDIHTYKHLIIERIRVIDVQP